MASTHGTRAHGRRPALVAIGALAVCTAAACSSAGSPPTATRPAATATATATSTATRPSAAASATITITPASALMDEPVAVTITGVAPGAAVTVTASTSDATHVHWVSTAQFTATSSGTVSLDQPPDTGSSYVGSNPMGLFQAMSPVASSATAFFTPVSGYPVRLQASVAGRTVATATTQRLGTASTGVTPTPETVAASGVHAILFMPKTSVAGKPAVVVLGGSEGGLAGAPLASSLADHGYPTLALAYFREPDLPGTLTNIPLEYFVKGIHLLDSQPGVDRQKLMVFGVSRGSEAALLLGAHFPDLVHGVIAGSPSMVTFGNFPSTGAAAWTLDGHPLTFGSGTDFTSGIPEPTDAPKAVIPVEQIKGPILTICGALDTVWHSCGYSDGITARLKTHRVKYSRTALAFPDAGHLAGSALAYIPLTTDEINSSGGTVVADADAMAQAHQDMLTWLSHQ